MDSVTNAAELSEALKVFCDSDLHRSHFKKYLHLATLTDTHIHDIINTLSNLLLDPKFTISILKCFSKYMLHLLSVAIPLHSDNYKVTNYDLHTQNCIALSSISKNHPDAHRYMLQYFEKYPAPFDKEYFENTKTTSPKRRKMEAPKVNADDLHIVESCYSFLKINADFFRGKWNWSAFIKQFYNSKNDMVKWICCHCIGVVTGMNELQLNSLLEKNLPKDKIIECTLEYHNNTKTNYLFIPKDTSKSDSSENNKPILLDNVISVAGILLPVYKKNTEITHLVPVKSALSNMRKVALGIAANRAVCLQGPVGSSKTALVEYLASLTGRKLGESFIKVQLGDQTDSKMLLGTYRCTDIPGEFVWQPGVLTQAVTEGNWLLLEDIDSASMDIATVVTSLLENGYLSVPGFRDTVPVTPGFHLFVTQRLITSITGYHKKHSNVNALLEKHLLQINIEPLNKEELIEIVKSRYPALTTIATRIIDVFMLFSQGHHGNEIAKISRNGRLTSTRDLFKWCERAIIDFDVSSQNSALKVFQDAIDIFCCSLPSTDERLRLAKDICIRLGIVETKAEFFCNFYIPNLSLTATNLTAGRTIISRNVDVLSSSKKSKFSFTRPSACLLERIIGCVNLKEPVLLVGETGTGKTSSVQYLSDTVGQKLIVINMNQQSDSADLLGGYKPVDLKYVIAPIKLEFELLFREYFSIEQNMVFLQNIANCFNNAKWSILVNLMKHSQNAAVKRLRGNAETKTGIKRTASEEKKNNDKFLKRWTEIGVKINKLSIQLKQQNALAFAFIEGSLVKAIKKGYWVLLDEINLANAETLECLSGLLEGKGSLSLLERGDRKPIERHEKFTLFACMNPSTDVGKKDLPAGLRNRFSEFFVEELTEKNDLILLVNSYLKDISVPKAKIESIVKFYLNIRKEALIHLSDGLGHKPHYSLRTLCRALTIASKNCCGSVERNLYEAFCLSFLTQLNTDSYKIVEQMIAKAVIGGTKEAKSVLKQPILEPKSDKDNKYVEFEGYWVSQGNLQPDIPKEYVLTESVRRNLKDLVRVVAIGRLPVLLQGDTSVGKTSLITYLAKASGNKCVRINNHEHTDLQEYIGSYIADINGKLIFREGVLVEAMRKGHWIILDELNLAPTDVLEALNRVLDDNRELFIPETQETVKAHPKFMLFATQNPPGAYGGRKMLSRAFRNRFVELHFNEIPPNELEIILHQRCEIPLSYCKKMIAVMTDLQIRRRGSAAFAGKQGFITLRDLFRWGERYRLAPRVEGYYDWDQHIADEGYLVLAGRVRKTEERNEITEVLKKHIKRSVLPENLFSLHDKTSPVTKQILQKIDDKKHLYKNIVWTFNTRQLAVLVGKALHFTEPVLLVGETGGGKTTVCKLIAENNGQKLITVNCHMHTESSDFIGGLRPVRERNEENKNKLFEWVDGPLLEAMQNGDVFLADEISLADDSVLERLNSLLEPERSLLLAEKGTDLSLSTPETVTLTATEQFHFIGTMNPGGDFGKKELSPALRNRFSEIWCETCTDRNDLIQIIEHNLTAGLCLGNQEDGSSGIGRSIMDFIEWFRSTEIGKRFTISIRDILTWVNFINVCSETIDISDAYIHGAYLTFLDSFGSGVTGMENIVALKKLRTDCTEFLIKQINSSGLSVNLIEFENINVDNNDKQFGIKPFYIKKGNYETSKDSFTFTAPTVLFNSLRLLRGLQLNKAILLEGSPGVGKTSLVSALAKITNHKLLRINLSDQTDICDLFGADLPVEGGQGGEFAWRDGPFLQALKNGDWIVLDELNLASQSVLEGLNACLDHRGEIFIPELGKTFFVKPGTRLFACQNPLRQGGSRRGLPKSFLNRFTQVYVDSLTETDLLLILSSQFSEIPTPIREKMIEFNKQIVHETETHKFGHKGSPWEFNLRDLTRWCQVMLYSSKSSESDFNPASSINLIYGDRMRTDADKRRVRELFENVFGVSISGDCPLPYVTKEVLYMGDVKMNRGSSDCDVNLSVLQQDKTCLVLRNQFHVLRSLMYCVNLNWMAILVGSSASGKSSVVKTLSQLSGSELRTLSVNSAMDTTDILGGFEQADYNRHLEEISNKTERVLLSVVQRCFLKTNDVQIPTKLMKMWEEYRSIRHKETENLTMADETKLFETKLLKIKDLLMFLKGHSYAKVYLEQLNTLQTGLDKLRKNVEVEGTLNAGGKFEWVDSILIKCLQDGCWLLIENVNLCSPAVLDRLNALLEPNGVLTIGERGVDVNGEMINIVPHPNFRLFLTMDPKNGEISRAMRNRGVEIYMLNEIEAQDRNLLDTKAMIEENGLNVEAFQEILLKMHDYISCRVMGEKPTVSHILQASFLISQQLLRGINIVEAFSSTITDVYVKTKSLNEFTVGNPVDEIETYVKETVETFLKNNDLHCSSNNTIKTMDSQINSNFELVKQQNVLQFLDTDETFKRENLLLQQFLNKKNFYFLLGYLVGSNDNLNLRYQYLINELKNSNNEIKAINENLYSTLNSYFKIYFLRGNREMPVDSRFLMDTTEKYTNINDANQIYLLLYFTMLKTLVKYNLTEEYKTSSTLSVLQYSKAVFDKKLSQYTIDHALIINFYKLIIIFDDFIISLLTTQTLELTSEDTIFAVLLLHWRFALQEIGSLIIFDKSKKRIDVKYVLRQLIVRYKWFIKHTVEYFTKLSNPDLVKHLNNVIILISSSVEHNFSSFSKISKRFIKNSPQPLPLTDQQQIEMKNKLHEIYNKTSLLYKNENYFKLQCYMTIHEPEFRQNLIKISKEIRNYNKDTFNEEEFTDVIKHLDEINKPETNIKEIQLIPIKEFFSVLIISHLRNLIFCEEKSLSITENCLTIKKLTTVSPELCEVVETYFETSREYLVPELTFLKAMYLQNAQIWTPNDSLNLELQKELSSHTPALTFVVTNICINDKRKDLICSVDLREYKEKAKQLKYLNEILWQNVPAFTSEKYNYNKNDTEYIINRFNTFTKLLEKSLSGQNSDASTSETIANIINKINEIYSLHPESEEMMKNKTKLMNVFNQLCQEVENVKSSAHLNNLIHTANVYCLLNYIKAIFNSQLPSMDRVEKNVLKKRYCQEKREICASMKEAFVAQNAIYSGQAKTLHPFCAILSDKISEFMDREAELDKIVAVRPEKPSYQLLVEECSYVLTTLLSDDFYVKIFEKLNNGIKNIKESLTSNSAINTDEIKEVLLQSSTWIHSQKQSLKKLLKYRVGYPEIIENILGNIAELSYGIKMLHTMLEKLLIRYLNKNHDLNKFMQNLIQFPVINESQNDVFSLIELCTANKNVNFISNTITNEEIPNLVKQENLRMLKCGIQELYNLIATNSPVYLEPQNKMLLYLENLINLFVSAWTKQESERHQKIEEEQSLYKTKSKCENLTEEQEDYKAMKLLFPNYHELDFSDFQQKQLDDTTITSEEESEFVGVITDADVRFVANIHSELMQLFTKSEWLSPKQKRLEPNYINPLLERYKLYNLMQNKLIEGVDNSIESHLICSLTVLVSVTKHSGDGEDIFSKITSSPRKTKEKSYDFYKDSKVEEVKSCLHILESLEKRVTELLNEWPQHPTLQSIDTVIKRIYSFPITSPVSRFLTGLEILLSKCHEWEETAHSGVSLQDYSQNLTLQIIEWRKIELSEWKNCLDNVLERTKNSVSKWWFHMYSSIREFIDKPNDASPQKLIKLFQEFIEKSPLGEFEPRLDLLYTFHCHTVTLPKSKNSESVVAILWNLYHYYAQFLPNVRNKLTQVRTPIAKKLKDFVKIARWNDINYWSVKETVEKTHRTLHKLIKEYENAIKQGVTDCLVNNNTDTNGTEQVGIWDRPTRHTPSQYHYSLEPSNYMASIKYKKLINENTVTSEPESDSLLSKTEKYFSKSRTLCKDVILNTSYPNLIQNLDSFVTEIIETSNHLRNLEVNKELDKKKQKSQAKSILQQKRKALADLFKTLAKCGLSYRTGIIESKLREGSSGEFLLKPLELNASFDHMKNKGACDKQLLNVWDGCETYFMRTISRLAGLESALKQPAKDLGLPNIERCKGFSTHLMVLAQEQKSKLIETSRNLYYLRNCINVLSDWGEESDIIKTKTVKSISNLLGNIIAVMEQYKIVLLSCPDQPQFESDMVDIPIVDTDNPVKIKYTNDPQWNKSLAEIKVIISATQKLKSVVDKLENVFPSTEIRMESSEYLFIQNKNNIVTELENLNSKLFILQTLFGNNAISGSVQWLSNEIEANLKLITAEYTFESDSLITVDKFKTDVEKLIESTLVIIQNLYKKYQKTSTEEEPRQTTEETEKPQEEEQSDAFEDNHLKSLVIENLFQDISTLEIKNVFKKVKKLIEKLYKMNLKDSKNCKTLLSHCVPLLEQISLLYQYFITQQVSAYRVTCKLSSVLLNIFIELASKGFCVPPEFSDEIDSEGQSNQAGGGMGLGEGEGEKDVSDRIETEDQLDDAQPAGQEKKNEDKDCKEEDKGIEMSEDFEGKLQDVDKPEDDESQSDDSDAEKQMGDTEKDSNKLDQQIWGSDEENNDDVDDEEEQGKQDKEEKGEGGELEDQHMAAKEDGSKPDEGEDDKQPDSTDKKKEQQKDINEMDEPEYDEDQVDPYHGKQPPLPEPEPMDLPDDLRLDEGEEKEEQNQDDENPFDIDKMKDQMPVEEEQNEEKGTDETTPETEDKNPKDSDSSDEEDVPPNQDVETDLQEERNEEQKDDIDQKESTGMQEKQNEDDNQPEETENQDASAPDNQQSKEDEIQPMDVDNVEASDNVQTNPNQVQNQQSDAISQEESEDKDGAGQTQMEESETGHRGEVSASKDNLSSPQDKETIQEKRQRPGESDTSRSLGETTEPVKKKLKTIDIQDKEDDNKEMDEGAEEGKDADIYQHIKEAKESDTQVMDAATKEQAETQKIQTLEEEEKDLEDKPTEMDTDEPEPEVTETPKEKSEKTESKSQKSDGKQQQGDIVEEIKDVEIEGDIVETMNVPRGTETSYHTQYELLEETQIERLSTVQIQDLRTELENQLGTWNEPPPNVEAEQTWEKFSAITSSLARDLSEQLRLVLEPTQASRLRGDFRTGRRINMRKVIPYIASQFRKDKIWLRRTKPSKREYQIVLAIDDSSSMDDNHSKELAFESVALISKALSLLESGQLSVLSFGETTEILHKLTDSFTEKSGVKLLQKFQFQQKKTCVANLVDFVTTMFSDSHTIAPNAKLLIIVSDGRGIFSEGETYVQQAIRRAKFADIFMVFVIIDNPENKNSVLDIRMPVFKDGKLLGIKSYLDNFPFPFYIILQDINSLPSVLSDALRQWFELVTNVDK